MSTPSFSIRSVIPRRAQRFLEAVLRALSLYVLPLGIAVISAIALFMWDDHYLARHDQPLELRVLAERDGPLAPAQVLARLPQSAPVAHADTSLSEAPFWFAFNTIGSGGKAAAVEFPSRHSIALACWDAATLRPLGSATRGKSEGALAPVKSGFALTLEASPSQVLCRGKFIGPARLTAIQWPAEELALSVEQYHRKSGLLDGGMIVL
ncbi:MAG: diguanylate cyclase, partial [Telluria sp.]